MQSLKQIFRLVIILAVISVFLSIIYFNCPITFNSDIETGDVVSLLLNFGVLALLLERFATQIIIREDYTNFMASHELLGYGNFKSRNRKNSNNKPMSLASEKEEEQKEFKQKLFWISFGIGMILAAIGYRFFYNVIDGPSSYCGYFHDKLVVILDVFLTGILLSGGAAFVLELIVWIKKK